MTYVNRVFLGTSENMSEIPDGVVDVCVTSPPYYALRDYGVDGQIGMEPSPAEYIERMVAVMREVKRVLKPQGSAFVNIGDSYFGDSPVRKASSESFSEEWDKSLTRSRGGTRRSAASFEGMKPKDLMLMPHRVAIALQQDGWWVRDDIVWCKPNPMPSSVNDRCTPCKEYVFHIAKSRKYYADMEAVKEPLAASSVQRLSQPTFDQQTGGEKDYANGTNPNRSIRKTLENLKRKQDALGKQTYTGFNDRWDENPTVGANLRNVWTIATEPYAGAHFATMPRELVRRCILIGAPDKCCSACGAPYVRKTDVDYVKSPVHGEGSVVGRHYETGANNWDGSGMPRLNKVTTTLGFEPTCKCDADVVPGLVLDPFMGSGTVAEVAIGCGRRYVGYELNPEYHDLIKDRLGLFGAA